jgi:hypothetical protein
MIARRTYSAFVVIPVSAAQAMADANSVGNLIKKLSGKRGCDATLLASAI